MRSLIRKVNRKACLLSVVVLGLITLISYVWIFNSLEGEAAEVVNADYYIEYKWTDANNYLVYKDNSGNVVTGTTPSPEQVGITSTSQGNVTFENVNFTSNTNWGFKTSEDITITLEGENTINSTVANNTILKSDGNITFKGNGSLTLIGKQWGLECKQLVIGDENNNPTINIQRSTTDTTASNARAVQANSCEINNGKINIGDENQQYTKGLNIDGTLTINGGQVTSYAYGWGMYAVTFNINGGEIISNCINAGTDGKHAIEINGNMNVQGGKVTANCEKNIYEKRAIKISGGLNISDGEIAANCTNEGGSQYAINIDGGMNMSGGSIKSYVEKTDHGRGIFITGTSTITGGHIEVEANGEYTKGIQSNSSLTMNSSEVYPNGATIDIKGNISGGPEEVGLFIKGSFIQNAGSIYVNVMNTLANNAISGIRVNTEYYSGDATLQLNGGEIVVNTDVCSDGNIRVGHGISSNGNVTINGGKIRCTTDGVGDNSAGINTDGSITINGGDIEFRNSNNTIGETGIRYGMYSTGTFSMVGGHVIVQGMTKAVGGTIKVGYSGDGALTTRGSTEFAGTNLVEIALDSSSIDDTEALSGYKYIEFGVAYQYYLTYALDNGGNSVFYKGSKASGTVMDDTAINALGITKGTTSTGQLAPITLNGFEFISKEAYALYIEGDVTIKLANNTINKITANTAIDGSTYGIYCTGTLTIEGPGELIVTGLSQAIRATNGVVVKSDSSYTGYETAVAGASKSIDGTNLIEYPDTTDWNTSTWSTYKYIEIGKLYSYYFKFDADNGYMYKVTNDINERRIYNNDLVQGWSIDENTKVLTLSEFNFTTNTRLALDIVGTTAKIVIQGDNYIKTTKGTTGSIVEYIGIRSSGTDISFSGTGTINLYSEGVTDYTAINCGGKLSMTGGTYNLTGATAIGSNESYGIKLAPDKELVVNNSTITAKGNSGAINVPQSSGKDKYDVNEQVIVSDDVGGASTTTVTDYYSNYYNYNSKKYIRMNPTVISVTVTWGDMSFDGNKVWDPTTFTYTTSFVASNTDSNIVKVQNDVGSNIPVNVECKYTPVSLPNSSGTYQIEGSITHEDSSENTVRQLGINGTFSEKLSLTDTNEDLELTTPLVVGSVSVILSDYRKIGN